MALSTSYCIQRCCRRLGYPLEHADILAKTPLVAICKWIWRLFRQITHPLTRKRCAFPVNERVATVRRPLVNGGMEPCAHTICDARW